MGARLVFPKKQGWKKVWWVVGLAGWVLCVVIASQLVIGYPMYWILGEEGFSGTVVEAVYSILSYGLALLVIIWATPKLIRKVGKSSREDLGLSGTPTWTDIGLAPIGFVVGTLLAGLLDMGFNLFPWYNAEEVQETGFSLMMGSGERVMAFLLLVVFVPIVEEVIFRGWLYGKIREKTGMAVGILVVSLVFGLAHMQWNVGVNVFAMSVVLCGLREITGTIYAGILMHMVKNGVAFFILYVLGR